MTALPRMALAVRQPWAWAIFHALPTPKDVENREWKRWKGDWKFRGRVAILASSGMTQAEYWHQQALGGEPWGVLNSLKIKGALESAMAR